MRRSVSLLAIAGCALGLAWVPAALGQEELPQEPLPEGAEAPDFEIQTLEGAPVKLSEWRGQVVVLNFFMTWYRYASEELKVMESLQTKYADRRLKLLSIALDQGENGPAVAAQFVTDNEIAHAVAADPEQKLSARYGVRPLPAIFVIGPDGKIARYQEGYVEGDAEHLDQMIADTVGAETEEQPPEEEGPPAEEEEPVCKCFKQAEG
jgi:peroxiredoxin